MTRWRPSLKVGRSARPMAAQVSSGSGSVATISEYTGATARRSPRQAGGVSLGGTEDHLGPHVAGVRAHHAGLDGADHVCSKRSTPRRSTTLASPRTRRAGWIAAQCGVNVAPSAPPVDSCSRASAGLRRRRSSSVNPRERAVSTSPVIRASWTRVCASTTVPPRWYWASIPSAAATRPTSRTVSCIARCWRSAASGPPRPARVDHEVGNRALHQPPLRPEAPKPATSCSSTAIRSPGSARLR